MASAYGGSAAPQAQRRTHASAQGKRQEPQLSGVWAGSSSQKRLCVSKGRMPRAGGRRPRASSCNGREARSLRARGRLCQQDMCQEMQTSNIWDQAAEDGGCARTGRAHAARLAGRHRTRRRPATRFSSRAPSSGRCAAFMHELLLSSHPLPFLQDRRAGMVGSLLSIGGGHM
jgi:hypothetical protein